ncbi:hypothetical protein [Rhodoferax sp.]|uniref:hypothetical protein n=1 Tax=Rhodoferax sp. TaxID=50421 RepID=UPI00260E67FA|nr:hypothetical protein [Rhodoferax sp.]MDD5479641.1 hypothetical protein [Rhodoferax sp.]
MKLIIQSNRIAGTATDAYTGPDEYADAPADFDIARLHEYVCAAGMCVLPEPDIQAVIVQAVQARLDAFAATRNYDGILSACTYATSTVPKFAAEGQAAVNARDQTWAALYEMLGNVQAGAWLMPTSFADVEPLLPVLVWPA